MERKKQLRKWIAQEKKKYSDSTLKALSEKVLTTLEAYPEFQKGHTILLYHSMKDEVQTHAFIEKWSRSKKIILPVVIGDELELRVYTGPQDLAISSYGIAEPTGTRFTDYRAIDLAVIPGVAFDRHGHRLGRGKGYYDRLLPQIAAPKAGICFPFQLVEEVPAEEFDFRMDTVIAQ
ncbi:5-formyltetrahydrofolate cyclo-ligase [Bacteroides fragilis]|uniref:5-formyltetrahydrofolate cyclo-ligase n=1 Tax=Bacteroides fragilis TaxID=817 RepID=UPI0008109827|nr:5-formyltetrahydrofolate cyclo-ligase [Bacteroides fragilis]MCZ2664832.1 5-formyltetrahydrofolate cyclo-ligase [Bacteroides fragilis]OCL15829.1 5-formyltetrahydrofolate cyclo-ligase [Bacteroides fragilis]OCM99378.1 5-formyltetrahydrofolate cyclo-ligase [Bacteroides fragilis]